MSANIFGGFIFIMVFFSEYLYQLIINKKPRKWLIKFVIESVFAFIILQLIYTAIF